MPSLSQISRDVARLALGALGVVDVVHHDGHHQNHNWESSSRHISDTAEVIRGCSNTNACPDGYSKITSYPACLASLHVLGPGNPEFFFDATEGSSFEETVNDEYYPSGCYDTCDSFYFNLHPTGDTDEYSRPLCAREFEPLVAEGVLWMGDSDMDYWKDTGSIATPSYNVGVGGYTCQDVIDFFDTMLAAFQPRTIVLVCGENDLGNGLSVEDTYARFRTLVDKVTASDSGVTNLVYMGTKDEPGTTELHTKYKEYDAKLMDLAQDLAKDSNSSSPPPLVVIDVNAGFYELGNPDDLYSSDELHLSPNGYAHWRSWVERALEDESSCVVWRGGDCVF